MKITHGKSIEITGHLSPRAAQAFAQWIGGYTVIQNQKTEQSNKDYEKWLSIGKPEDKRPDVNSQTSYLCDEFSFLKEIPSQIRRNAGAKWAESVNAAKAGLRKRPKIRGKHKKRNCYVTNELFDVQAIDDERCLIQIKQDAKKTNRGNYLAGVIMPFSEDDAGKALYISRKGRRFWLSMSFRLEKDVLTENEIKKRLTGMSDEQLQDVVTGYDLGVVRQVTGSDSKVYHISIDGQDKLKIIEKRRKRYQRNYARMSRANDRQTKQTIRKRTNNERKMLDKIAKYSEKMANIKHYNSHVIAKQIAEATPLCASFENLKLQNMVRRPKPKKCEETGKWLVNGAKAKAGLNKSILGVNLGQIRAFARYKLAEKGKLLILVKPHNSSRECNECGHTEKDNRETQAKFKCKSCGYEANADDNAAQIVKKRGIQHTRTEAFSKEKTVKKIRAQRKQAHELASSGSGENVSLAQQAVFDDAPNFDGHKVTNVA